MAAPSSSTRPRSTRRWPEAAAEFAQSVTPEYTSPFAYNERMLAQLQAGDRQGYRTSYRELLDQINASPSPFAAYLGAVACTLGPDDLVDRTVPVRLAETALKAFREDAKGDGLFALGAAYYRGQAG